MHVYLKITQDNGLPCIGKPYTHLGNNCTVEIGIFPSPQKIGLAICETKPKVACTLPIKIERLDIHSDIITVKYYVY